MPREAGLFTSSAGSVVRGYLKFRAIKNARGSRKRIEPEIAESFQDEPHRDGDCAPGLPADNVELDLAVPSEAFF
jgi:hypothetical protein